MSESDHQMTTSVSLKFDDPYAYQHAVRAANVDGFVADRGDFGATLTKVDLGQLWLQAGAEKAGRSYHVSVPRTRSPVFFMVGPKQGKFELSGLDIAPGQIVFWGEDVSHYHRTTAASGWGSMSLEPAQLAEVTHALAGREILASKDTRVLSPDAEQMARLLSLHGSATRLASTAPDMLRHPEIAHALEQALVDTLVRCLSGGVDAARSGGWRNHLRIMAGFEEWLALNPDRPAYLAEICAALGVSQRTLNICCHEHLGLSPTRYLWLRRMHLARRELLRASLETTTVAEVAMNHGFWELGRFSVSYKALFGESPSGTLRAAPRHEAASSRSPFALSA